MPRYITVDMNSSPTNNRKCGRRSYNGVGNHIGQSHTLSLSFRPDKMYQIPDPRWEASHKMRGNS